MKTYRPIIKTYPDDYGDQKANASMVESGEHRDKYVPYSDVAPLVEALRKSRRELQSCQAVIHLHGGFDPNYVYAAQESIRETDAALSTLDADGSKS